MPSTSTIAPRILASVLRWVQCLGPLSVCVDQGPEAPCMLLRPERMHANRVHVGQITRLRGLRFQLSQLHLLCLPANILIRDNNPEIMA